MTWSVGAGLEGKGVIVTGATGGIGKAVAEAFATTGAKVMAVDLDQAVHLELVQHAREILRCQRQARRDRRLADRQRDGSHLARFAIFQRLVAHQEPDHALQPGVQ